MQKRIVAGIGSESLIQLLKEKGIEITEDIYLIREIIQDIMQKEKGDIAQIIEYHIKKGKSDGYIITQLPLTKNSYYRLKQKIHEKIYNCCIEKKVVSYEEILVDSII